MAETHKEIKTYNFLFSLLVGREDATMLFKRLNKKQISSILQQINYSTLDVLFLNFLYSNNLHAKLDHKTLQLITKRSKKLVTRNLAIQRSCRKIANTLIDKRVNFIFLKGAWVTNEIYDDFSFRTLKDIDMLVEKSKIDKTIECLIQSGFSFVHNKDYDELFFSSNHYDIPWMVNKDGVIVEIHYSIKPNKNGCNIAKEMLNSKNMYRGMPFASTELNFLHILYHGTSKELFGSGLFFIKDLVNIERSKELDQDKILKYAKLLGLTRELKFYIDFLEFFNFKSKISNLKNIDASMNQELFKTCIKKIFTQKGVSRKRFSNFKKILASDNLVEFCKELFKNSFPKFEVLEREALKKLNIFTYFFYLFRRWIRQYNEFGSSLFFEIFQPRSIKKNDIEIYRKIETYFN